MTLRHMSSTFILARKTKQLSVFSPLFRNEWTHWQEKARVNKTNVCLQIRFGVKVKTQGFANSYSCQMSTDMCVNL